MAESWGSQVQGNTITEHEDTTLTFQFQHYQAPASSTAFPGDRVIGGNKVGSKRQRRNTLGLKPKARTRRYNYYSAILGQHHQNGPTCQSAKAMQNGWAAFSKKTMLQYTGHKRTEFNYGFQP